MRIYCMQAATFNHVNDYEIKHRVEANKFVDVPDWVADTEMFKLLQMSKKITIIGGSKDVSNIEKANGKVVAEEMKKSGEVVVEDIDYTKMKAKELYTICVERGIEAEEKQSKEYYLDLLK